MPWRCEWMQRRQTASTSFFTYGGPVSHCCSAASPAKKSENCTLENDTGQTTPHNISFSPSPTHSCTVCCMLSTCPPVTAGLCGLEVHEAEAWSDADCGCGGKSLWNVDGTWLGGFPHSHWGIGSIIIQYNGLSPSAIIDSQTDHRPTVWHAANRAAIMRSSRWLSISAYILLPQSFY